MKLLNASHALHIDLKMCKKKKKHERGKTILATSSIERPQHLETQNHESCNPTQVLSWISSATVNDKITTSQGSHSPTWEMLLSWLNVSFKMLNKDLKCNHAKAIT